LARKINTQIILDSSIGSEENIIGNSNYSKSLTYLRNFDPHRFVLSFGEEEYDINQVVNAVQEILGKTKIIVG
jgi:hypothetical protein